MGHKSDMLLPMLPDKIDHAKRWIGETDLGRFFDETFLAAGLEAIEHIEYYDVVFCHRPACFSYVFEHHNVICDFHDLYSADPGLVVQDGEKLAISAAAKAIFVSGYMKRNAEKLGCKADSIIIPNCMPKGWIKTKTWFKARRRSLGLDDSKLHVVYEGGLATNQGHHRYFIDLFREIGKLDGVVLHLYTPWAKGAYLRLPKDYPDSIVMHEKLMWEEIANELGAYDVSLCPFVWPNDCQENVISSIPGKVGYATAVGTPSLIEVHMDEAWRFGGDLCLPVFWDDLLEGYGYLEANLKTAAALRGNKPGGRIYIEGYADELEGLMRR